MTCKDRIVAINEVLGDIEKLELNPYSRIRHELVKHMFSQKELTSLDFLRMFVKLCKEREVKPNYPEFLKQLDNIHEAYGKPYECTCCGGSTTHITPIRERGEVAEVEYDACETCLENGIITFDEFLR